MTRPLRVVVLADTHLPEGGPPRRDLPAEAWKRIEGCDAVLHAGDVVGPRTLARLEEKAPTHAVLGNNDRALVGVLPETRTVELAGVRIGVVHDSGPRVGRAARLHRRFPEADIVVFGHSHIPWDELGVDGQVLFNPGSPTTRRAQPTRTMGELIVEGGRILSRQLIDLGP